MSLTTTYERLLASARLQSAGGQEAQAEAQLAKGASMAVRAAGDRVQLIVRRVGAPLGQVELATFEGHCKVPKGAERWPVEGQSQRGQTYRVAWSWTVPREMDLSEEEPTNA